MSKMASNKKTNVALESLISPAVSDGMTETEEDTKKEMEMLKDPCCSKDEERHIQIFVSKCGIAPICLKHHPSTTVFSLKGILQDKLGIPPEKQHLSTVKGIVLCDDLSLEEQQIKQDTNLELSIGPGLLGGAKKKNKGGKQKKDHPKPPSGEKRRQKNKTDKSQSDSTPTSSDGKLSRFLSWLIGIFYCMWNFIMSIVWRLLRREQPEPNVQNINANKSPVILGNSFWSTFNYYNSSRPSGGNDETDATADPQRSRARQSDAADWCEEELRARYKNKDSLVQMNPLLTKMHIQHIFTDLVLESHDEGGGSQEGRRNLESYEEVFTLQTIDGDLINRTIFEGKAGLGKSTLISKIVYDWANNRSEVLKKFKLVFALKMHALEETSDFIKAVFDQLLAKDTRVVKTDLQSYIQANPENVLILLDGFDEFMTTTLNQTNFGSVLEIVSGNRLSKCYAVVTTRPAQYHTLRTELIPDTLNRVKVLGFRKEDIEKYVKQVYSNKQDKAEELLQKIQSSDVLSELVKSPMLLLMVCALWLESSSLPATLFLLYKDALKYLFGRKGNMVIQEKEVSCIVNEIGKVALNGQLSEIQQLSFPEKLFEKTALKAALDAGILTNQKVLKGLELQNSIQFLHKTFQEFCAGLYLQNLQKKNFDEFQKILGQIKGMGNMSNLDYLLRFCCGGNDECTNAVLAILKEKCPEDHSLALNCYFENQSKEPPTEDFINLVVTDKLSIKGFDFDSLNSFAYFLKHVMKRNEGAVFLGKVEKVVLRNCNLERFIHKLFPSLANMRNLSVLKFNHCQGLGSSGRLWALYLRKIQKLGKLNLEYCDLKDYDVQHIPAIVTLFSLDLSHNDKLGGKADLWAPCLEKMGNLNELKLRDCSLVGGDVKILAGMVKLINLQLSSNIELRHSVSEWSKCLCCLKHLEILFIDDCNIATEDLKFIAKSCSDMPSLVTCSVDNNVYPTMNYQLKISGGTALHIRGCSLSNENLVDILMMMRSNRSHREELNLSDFEKLSPTDTAWCAQLQQFQHLKRLVFNKCGLKVPTIQCIVEQLKNMRDLAELYLNSNTNLKGTANGWFPLLHMLHRLVPLKKVVLEDCKLTKEDWEHIKTYRDCEVTIPIVRFK